MKNRKKQRENRSLKRAQIDRYSFLGAKDLTPHNALRVMRSRDYENIVYK